MVAIPNKNLKVAMSCFKIFQANVQSLAKNKAEVHRILTANNYTAAFLSETWTNADMEDSNRYRITDFHFVPHSRDDNYGGVGIYLNVDWNYQRITAPTVSHYTQIVMIKVIQYDLVLCAVYVSPSISAVEYNNDIQQLFAALTRYKKVVIGGDFNSHHVTWGDSICDTRGQTLMDEINSSGFLILNDGSRTFVPLQLNRRSTAIDITLCSTELFGNVDWNVLDYGVGGDHLGINIELNRVSITHRKFFFDKKKISEEVGKLEAIQIGNINDLGSCVRRIQKKHRRRDNKEPKYWWSTEVDQAWQEKTAARREFNRASSQENLLEFKRKAAIFQRKKREEIRRKLEALPDEVGPFTDSKELWYKVGKLTGKRIYRKENNILYEDEAKAQTFLDVHFRDQPGQQYHMGMTTCYQWESGQIFSTLRRKHRHQVKTDYRMRYFAFLTRKW